MQFSGCVGVRVLRPAVTETTALGAAYLADWPSAIARFGRDRGNWALQREYRPVMQASNGRRATDGGTRPSAGQGMGSGRRANEGSDRDGRGASEQCVPRGAWNKVRPSRSEVHPSRSAVAGAQSQRLVALLGNDGR